MHEVEGLFCNSVFTGLISKFPGAEKKHKRAESEASPTIHRGGDCSPMGFSPLVEEAGWIERARRASRDGGAAGPGRGQRQQATRSRSPRSNEVEQASREKGLRGSKGKEAAPTGSEAGKGV